MCDCELNNGSRKKFSWDDKVTICSQGIDEPIIPSSCLTKQALIRIVNSWNHDHPDDLILDPEKRNANNLYTLVKEKMKSMYGCTSEECWVESLQHPQGAKESLLSLFKPEYPDSFKNNPNTGWRTSQINKVLHPYTYSHPFYWCGAVPLDFKEKRTMKLCLSRELCAVDLEDLVRQGCCLVGVIFNLDYSYESGSHWVAGMVDITRGNVCYFDSYGYEPLALIREWMDNCVNSLQSLVKKKQWTNCDSYQLLLKKIQWDTNDTFTVKQSVPHHLKIDEGMIMKSKKSGRMFVVKERLQRKQYCLDRKTQKLERNGEWLVMGARTFTLSKRVQLRGTECGSYCIHVILESLYGKSWHQIIKEIPGDWKMQQIRERLHRKTG